MLQGRGRRGFWSVQDPDLNAVPSALAKSSGSPSHRPVLLSPSSVSYLSPLHVG